MAAPTKQGLDYFPYDIELDQDDKLAMIIAEFGLKGEILYTKMLAWTYKHEGYYFDWREDVQLRFLRRYDYCGFSMSFIKEVVPRFIRWGLFDQTVFDAFQILTSPRIQKTWLDVTRKRIGRNIELKYWLKEIKDGIPAELTQLTPEVMDKGKESKENETKEELIVDPGKPGPPSTEPAAPKDTTDEKKKKCTVRELKFGQDLAVYVDNKTYSKEMVRAFYDYWRERNKSGTKMKWEMEETWETKLRLVKWEKNQYKFGNQKSDKADEQPSDQVHKREEQAQRRNYQKARYGE